MWIWLDKYGRVKQYLTHGPSPVVGETDFQIFVYFDDLNIDYFDSATIKFRKPDQQGSVYPVLFMRRVDMVYEHMSSDGDMSLFNEENSPYPGFLFDFSDFTDGEEIVRLLDTPGLWEATVTCLGAPNKVSVSGLITFNVGSAAGDSETQTELSIDQILENLVLNQRMLKKSSTYYLRVSDNFTTKAAQGLLDASTFVVGAVVFDEAKRNFYKIQTVTVNRNDDTKVYATYKKAFEYLRFADISNSTNLSDIYNLDDGNVVLVRNGGKFYLAYVSSNVNLASFEIRDLTTGKRYHSNSVGVGLTFANAIVNAYYVPGTYYTPHVSETGDLSWTNNNNEPNPNPVNIRGPQGIQGIQGIQGESAQGAVYFKVNEENGHLIMYFSNVETNHDFRIVNDNPSSPDYWETLGLTENEIGHLVFIYEDE